MFPEKKQETMKGIVQKTTVNKQYGILQSVVYHWKKQWVLYSIERHVLLQPRWLRSPQNVTI